MEGADGTDAFAKAKRNHEELQSEMKAAMSNMASSSARLSVSSASSTSKPWDDAIAKPSQHERDDMAVARKEAKDRLERTKDYDRLLKQAGEGEESDDFEYVGEESPKRAKVEEPQQVRMQPKPKQKSEGSGGAKPPPPPPPPPPKTEKKERPTASPTGTPIPTVCPFKDDILEPAEHFQRRMEFWPEGYDDWGIDNWNDPHWSAKENCMAAELGLPWWIRGPPGPEKGGPTFWKSIPWNAATQHWTWTRELVRQHLEEYSWADWNSATALAEEHALAAQQNLPWSVRGPPGPD